MQTLPVHYTDRIWGFQAQLVKTVTRAEIKVITGKNPKKCRDYGATVGARHQMRHFA